MRSSADASTRAPDQWGDAPVGNTAALVILALTGVYFAIVPQAALLVGTIVVGIVLVTAGPVIAAAALITPVMLYGSGTTVLEADDRSGDADAFDRDLSSL